MKWGLAKTKVVSPHFQRKGNMDLLSLNLFRGSIFKQIKFLFSSHQSSQTAYYISEAGTVSKEIIPILTGFMTPTMIKKAWIVIHSLKFQSHKKGLPIQGDATLLISDRSYIPLDPNEIIHSEDKERLTSLKDIARMRHAGARTDVRPDRNESMDVARLVINGCFILLGIVLVVGIIMWLKKGGG